VDVVVAMVTVIAANMPRHVYKKDNDHAMHIYYHA
jgi:hypothetical protein